jgi:hypothetical protein
VGSASGEGILMTTTMMTAVLGAVAMVMVELYPLDSSGIYDGDCGSCHCADRPFNFLAMD